MKTDAAPDVRLTSAGQLRWEAVQEEAASAQLAQLQKVFSATGEKACSPLRLERLLAETIALAVREKHLPNSDLERVTVDTTVQEKNIIYPTESKLLYKAIGEYLRRNGGVKGLDSGVRRNDGGRMITAGMISWRQGSPSYRQAPREPLGPDCDRRDGKIDVRNDGEVALCQ